MSDKTDAPMGKLTAAMTMILVAVLIIHGLFIMLLGIIGIDLWCDGVWAWVAAIVCFGSRSMLPFAIFGVGGAHEVFGWDWVWCVLFAMPGLAFAVPGAAWAMIVGLLGAGAKAKVEREERRADSMAEKECKEEVWAGPAPYEVSEEQADLPQAEPLKLRDDRRANIALAFCIGALAGGAMVGMALVNWPPGALTKPARSASAQQIRYVQTPIDWRSDEASRQFHYWRKLMDQQQKDADAALPWPAWKAKFEPLYHELLAESKRRSDEYERKKWSKP